ncbi:MAG: M16 family metallopeptidase [Verrucomicrobiales bacterium]
MKLLRIITLLVATLLQVAANGASTKFFPYDYSVQSLSNGMKVVTVPTEHKNLVALYLVVQVGSRNEVEPGKSGFAHFFEHMMFRGSENYTSEQRDAIMKKAGAESNAYTTDDRTVYHAFFAKEDLEEIVKLEADRFQRLNYSTNVYKTEARAVLGEYNKNSANPYNKLFEVLRERAFTKHTYKHTTMGFIEDIEDMPNQFDYSLKFYQRYYRPEFTTLMLVGDINHETSMELAKKYFAGWKKGNYQVNIPVEPPQKGARNAMIDWPSSTLPLVAVAYHGPAYSDDRKDKAALDFVAPLAFGENSELYQKLVLKEQKVEELVVSFDDQVDPELFAVVARVKSEKDVDYVREQIIATFQKFSKEPVSAERLEETKSRMRYQTALGWQSASSIAGFLASYINLRGSPETVEKLFKLYSTITPTDVRDMSAKYFGDENRTTVTLVPKATVREEKK